MVEALVKVVTGCPCPRSRARVAHPGKLDHELLLQMRMLSLPLDIVEDPLALFLSRVGSSEFILKDVVSQIHDDPELDTFETKDVTARQEVDWVLIG
jgi:hypothetical protein